MLIQILESGCVKCMKLADLAVEAAKQAGVNDMLEKVADINKIISFGAMTTPELVVDGKVKCPGNVPRGMTFLENGIIQHN